MSTPEGLEGNLNHCLANYVRMCRCVCVLGFSSLMEG